MKATMTHTRKFSFAVLYGLLSAIGINLFLSPANVYSIGIPGIAQLLNGILSMVDINLSISTLVVIMNIPLVLAAWYLFGLNYTMYSLIAVFSNVIFLQVIPQAPILSERITNAIVGGTIIGIGVGLCFRNGFSTGGTDVFVSYVQQRFKKKIGFINTVINGSILLTTGLFFGIAGATYSLISMVITSFIMDNIYIQQKNMTVFVFTKNPHQIIERLKNFAHGATLFKGTGIYSQQETDMIIVIAQRSQLFFLKRLVTSCDPRAFVSVQRADYLIGNYIQKYD
ncbi:YitT family protein [Sporolactobacillus sp. STSJ-5]|uniref:YitT family protein n=1 Tax=Sporolactobacillus sp. STSJ-5 TaxID=2965076 RepID=UPI002106E14A|nr:YitT family protein [Sporolactobacillus sp. STSJ-5]MCQ2011261.1 YitT family protein [Sporolactobacillus sp. STSJ-5]